MRPKRGSSRFLSPILDAVADRLVAELESHSIEALIDRRDLPYGEEWQKELADFIRVSDTVLWLVSPDSVKSKWVNWELGEVGRLSKRLIPIRIREINPASLPESLGKIHLLPADCLFEIGQHLELLIDVLNTDTAWLKEATRLADRARQWISKERDRGLLLRGGALADAETWARTKPRSTLAISGEILDLVESWQSLGSIASYRNMPTPQVRKLIPPMLTWYV